MSNEPERDPADLNFPVDESASDVIPISAGREFSPNIESRASTEALNTADNGLNSGEFPDSTLPEGRLLFQSFMEPQIPPRARIPNLGDVLLLAVFACFGLMMAGIVTRLALHFRLFGISTDKQATTDIHYMLGNMTALYLTIYFASILIFPLLWHKGLFAGLEWNLATAVRKRKRLFSAACICFVLALVDELVLPGPANAPIDKLFQTPTQAWLLFAYGVTLAPFFEEILFRGFLLPALATAFDWTVEHFTQKQPPPLNEDGHPQWSLAAMAVGSILTSIPFAWMHAEQTAYSLGPFLLLVSVSLVLCWSRLATRSLAASMFVHASYNFLLFSIMMIGTGGFRHLDKL